VAVANRWDDRVETARATQEVKGEAGYKGDLQLGPPSAPALLSVPIVVHRQ
jgi:hypothetical protein